MTDEISSLLPNVGTLPGSRTEALAPSASQAAGGAKGTQEPDWETFYARLKARQKLDAQAERDRDLDRFARSPECGENDATFDYLDTYCERSFGIRPNRGNYFNTDLGEETALKPFASAERYLNALMLIKRHGYEAIASDRYRAVTKAEATGDLRALARALDVPTEKAVARSDGAHAFFDPGMSEGFGNAVGERTDEEIEEDVKDALARVKGENFIATMRAVGYDFDDDDKALLQAALAKGDGMPPEYEPHLAAVFRESPEKAARLAAMVDRTRKVESAWLLDVVWRPLWTDGILRAAKSQAAAITDALTPAINFAAFDEIVRGSSDSAKYYWNDDERAEYARLVGLARTRQMQVQERGLTAPMFGVFAPSGTPVDEEEAKRRVDMACARRLAREALPRAEQVRRRREQMLIEDAVGYRQTYEYGYANRAIAGALSSVGYMATSSVGMGAGFALNTLAQFQTIRDDMVRDGLDPDTALGAQLVSAAVWSAIEKAQVSTAFGKPLTGLQRKVMAMRIAGAKGAVGKFAAIGALARAGSRELFVSTLAESVEEGLQGGVEGFTRGALWTGDSRNAFDAALRQAGSDFAESLGSMAVISGVGMGWKTVTANRQAKSYESLADFAAKRRRAVNAVTGKTLSPDEATPKEAQRALNDVKETLRRHGGDITSALDEVRERIGLDEKGLREVGDYLDMQAALVEVARQEKDAKTAIRLADFAGARLAVGKPGARLDAQALYDLVLPGTKVEDVKIPDTSAAPAAPAETPELAAAQAEVDAAKVTLPTGESYVLVRDSAAPDVHTTSWAQSVAQEMEETFADPALGEGQKPSVDGRDLSLDSFRALPAPDKFDVAVTPEQYLAMTRAEREGYCSNWGLGEGARTRILDETGRELLGADGVVTIKDGFRRFVHRGGNWELAHEHGHFIAAVAARRMTPGQIATMRRLFGDPTSGNERWNEENANNQFAEWLRGKYDFKVSTRAERRAKMNWFQRALDTVKHVFWLSGERPPVAPVEREMRERALDAAFNALRSGDFSGLDVYAGIDFAEDRAGKDEKDAAPDARRPAAKASGEKARNPAPEAGKGVQAASRPVSEAPAPKPAAKGAERPPQSPEGRGAPTASADFQAGYDAAVAAMNANPGAFADGQSVRTGGKMTVFTPDYSMKVEAEPMWTPLASLVESTDDREVQMRDRTRAATDEQTHSKTRPGVFQPLALFPGSKSDDGAPIVGGGNRIISGHGRKRMLDILAQEGRFGEYLDAVAAEAKKRGLTPPPDGMENPVLVLRVTGGLDRREDLVRFAELSNRWGGLERSGAEFAEAAAPVQTPPAVEAAPSGGARFSVRVNPRLREDISRAVNGDADGKSVGRRAEVAFSSMPTSLIAVGLPDFPIRTRADIVRKLRGRHGFSEEQIASLPGEYDRPAAVFRNGGAYVVLTGMQVETRTGGEKPVMVVLRESTDRNGRHEFLASAYPREEANENFYEGLARNGGMLFLDKNKVAVSGLSGRTISTLNKQADGNQVKTPEDLSSRSSARIVPQTGAAAQGGGARLSVTSAWRHDFPKAVCMTTRAAMMAKHGDLFRKAKAGGVRAAAQLVKAVVKPEKIAALIADHPDASIVCPVYAEEATGRNKIPRAFAKYIAKVAGIETDQDIMQSVRAFHSGANAKHRLFVSPEFDGKVTPGAEYILVDDHITQGGTVNALRDHIEANGGKVVAIAALTLSQGSSILAPRKETLDEIKRKWPDIDDLLKSADIAERADALTESQLRYILRFSPDAFRDRVAQAGREGGGQGAGRALRGREAASEGTPSEGVSRESLPATLTGTPAEPGRTRSSVTRRGSVSLANVATALFAQRLLAGKEVSAEDADILLRNIGLGALPAPELLARAKELAEKNREKVKELVRDNAPELVDALVQSGLEAQFRDALDGAITGAAEAADPSVGREVQRAVQRHETRELMSARGFDAAQMMAELPIDLSRGILSTADRVKTPEERAKLEEARKRREEERAAAEAEMTDEERLAAVDDPTYVPPSEESLALFRQLYDSAKFALEARQAEERRAANRRERRRKEREAEAAEEEAGTEEGSADAAPSASPGSVPSAQADADALLPAETVARIAPVFDSPELFAQFLVEWTAKHVVERHPNIPSTAQMWKNPVAIRELKQTAAHVLRKLARDCLGSPSLNYARNFVDHQINELESDAETRTYKAVLRKVAYVYDAIHENALRLKRRELVNRLVNGYRAKSPETGRTETVPGIRQLAGVKGRFSAVREEFRRDIDARTEVWARTLVPLLTMGEERLASEIAEMERRLSADPTAEDYEPMTDDRRREMADRLALARKYGGLVRRMPGEIADAADEILSDLNGRRQAFEQRRLEREERCRAVVEPIVKAMEAGGNGFRGEKWAVTKWIESMQGDIALEMQNLVRFCRDPGLRRAALAAIDEVRVWISEGESRYLTALHEAQTELNEGLAACYGSAEKGIRHLTGERIPEDVAVRIFNQGGRRPSYGQLLQLYASAIQSDYRENAEKHGRTAQLPLMEQTLTDADRAFHAFAVEWHKRNRRALSDAVETVTGLPVTSPDALYCRVCVKGDPEGIPAHVVAWSPVPAALNRRVRHGKDFDESAEFFSVLSRQCEVRAQAVGLSMTGILLRDTIGSREVRLAAERHVGRADIARVMDHVRDILVQDADGAADHSMDPVNVARKWAARFGISGNVSSMLAQPASIPVWANVTLGGKHIGLANVARYMATVGTKEAQAAVDELVADMGFKARYEMGWSEEVANVIKHPSRNRFFRFIEKGYDKGMVPSHWTDRLCSLWIAQGFYRDATRHFLERGEALEEAKRKARAITIAAVEATQQSGRVSALNALQRKKGVGGSVARAFFQFKTAQVLTNNFIIQSVREVAARPTDRAAWGQLVRSLFIASTLVPAYTAAKDALLAWFMGDEPPEEDPEKWPEWFRELCFEMVSGVTAPVFFAQQVVETPLKNLLHLRTYGRDSGMPAIDGAMRFVKTLSDVVVDAFDVEDALHWDKVLEDLDKIARQALAPVRHGKRMYDNRWGEGAR